MLALIPVAVLDAVASFHAPAPGVKEGAGDRDAASPPKMPATRTTTAAAAPAYRHQDRRRRAGARSSTVPPSSGGGSASAGLAPSASIRVSSSGPTRASRADKLARPASSSRQSRQVARGAATR